MMITFPSATQLIASDGSQDTLGLPTPKSGHRKPWCKVAPGRCDISCTADRKYEEFVLTLTSRKKLPVSRVQWPQKRNQAFVYVFKNLYSDMTMQKNRKNPCFHDHLPDSTHHWALHTQRLGKFASCAINTLFSNGYWCRNN
jgi:hypothetical protein